MTDYSDQTDEGPPEVAAAGITFTLTPEQLTVGAGYHGSIKLVDLVVERAAQLLVEKQDARAYQKLRDQVYAELKDTIRAELDKLVADAFAAAIRPTNRWGEPTGEATTLRDVILKEVAEWLNEARPTTGNRRDQLSPFRRLLEEEVEKAVKGDLKESMDTARAAVKAKVAAVATEQLSDTIARAFR